MHKKQSEIWPKQSPKCVSVCECECESVWEDAIVRACDCVLVCVTLVYDWVTVIVTVDVH
jgi:hypothetical protein